MMWGGVCSSFVLVDNSMYYLYNMYIYSIDLYYATCYTVYSEMRSKGNDYRG